MEKSAHVGVEFVEFVDGFSAVDVVENSIVEDKVVRGVKGRPVAKVVAGFVRVV